MKISNPFKRCRPLSHQEYGTREFQQPSIKDAHPARSPEQRTHSRPHHPSPCEILDELARIQTNVHLISARIQHLQDLISRDETGSTRATELIHRLKKTHAELQIYREAVERQLGGGAADMVGDVADRVTGAIERLVEVESRMLGGSHGEGEQEVMMSGALPNSSEDEDSSADTMDLLGFFPRAATHLPSSPSSLTRTVWNPRPRTEVIASLQHEESRTSLHVEYPDTVRRGSADGFTITYMIMSGAIDHRFVLPYFAYIEHCEVRGLKNWLADRDIVTKNGGVSRTEKVLHCVQMLQTGMRYESIAVVFSRSPQEVVGSCREVIGGLLEMHEEMVGDGEGEDEVNGTLWGIAKRYEVNQGAEEYFGYSWSVVQKTLVALNTFIARYRGSQSTVLRRNRVWWGRFEDTASNGVVWEDLESYRGSSDGEGQVGGAEKEKIHGGLHGRYENLEERHGDGGDETAEARENGTGSPATRRSSSPYEEPNLEAIPRPLVEGD